MGLSLKGMFGGVFGSRGRPSFQLPDREARAKIDELSSFAKSDITGPSQAGALVLEDVDAQKLSALNQLAEQQQSQQATGLSNLALFGGGAGGGSAERLSRAGLQQGIQSRQNLFGEFGDIRRRSMQEDLFNEQARRDAARQQALRAEMDLLGARTSAELGRAGLDAQRRASKYGLVSGLFKTGAAAAAGGG
jgi:hypothetical protein